MSSRFKHFLIEAAWLVYQGVIAGVVTYVGQAAGDMVSPELRTESLDLSCMG